MTSLSLAKLDGFSIFKRSGIDTSSESVLDIGCGIGLLHPYLTPFVKRLVGVDLSADALAKARELNPTAQYEEYEGEHLPFGNGVFDLALAVTVIHHVPVAQWSQFVEEAHRILKPGGVFVVIEHNPLNPATTYLVKRSELDADAVLLRASRMMALMHHAGFQRIGRDYIFFVPFGLSVVHSIERCLAWLPMGAQYAAYGFKPQR